MQCQAMGGSLSALCQASPPFRVLLRLCALHLCACHKLPGQQPHRQCVWAAAHPGRCMATASASVVLQAACHHALGPSAPNKWGGVWTVSHSPVHNHSAGDMGWCPDQLLIIAEWNEWGLRGAAHGSLRRPGPLKWLDTVWVACFAAHPAGTRQAQL